MTPAQLSLTIALGFGLFSWWCGFIAGKLQRLIEAIDRNADAVDDFRAAFNTHMNKGELACFHEPPCCAFGGQELAKLARPCKCDCHL